MICNQVQNTLVTIERENEMERKVKSVGMVRSSELSVKTGFSSGVSRWERP